MPDDPAERLRAENEELRARLEEAEATLDAIRKGEVDALVVAGADGHRVYTLEGADRFYRVLIEAMQPGQGAASLSADGTILYCNRSFAALLSVPQEKVGGRSFHEFVAPSDLPTWQGILTGALAAQSQGEVRLRPAAGPPVPVHLAVNALPLSGAVALGLVVTDLTARKQQEETARRLVREEVARAAAEQVARQAQRAEAAVRQSEARFRHLADALPQMVWMARPDGHVDYYNQRWFEYTGHSPGAEGDEGWTPFLHPDDVPSAHARWYDAVRSGQEYQIEYRLRDHRSGGYRWFLGRAVPVRDESGRVVRWFGTCTDIDDTKKAGERQRLLGEAASVLLTSDEPDAMMRGLFARIAPALGLDTYFNFMVDDSGAALRLLSCVGVPDEAARSIARLEYGQAICGTVALHRRPVVATFIQQSDDPKAQLIKSFGVRAYACNPLLAGDRLLGTLSFASRSRDRFDDDEVEFLRTVSRYVTVAYERLRLVRQLREADRRKDEFLATLAHELRNPLAPIGNGLQIIRMAGVNGPVEQVRAMMDRQLAQLVRLVDDLLDVSRITRGKLELRRERVLLRAVIDAAVETVRPLAEQAGHRLDVAVPDEPVVIDGDGTRLSQIVSNLLNNSIKYTRRGGHIRLTAERKGGEVTVAVRDDGIGIPPAMLGRVFEMFTQVDRTLEKTTGGLGIGLALVKGLVEMHGGTIDARSDGEGRGSEFVVRLPLAAAGPGESDDIEVESGGRAASGRRRVLVVDDNVDSAESMELMLTVLGHDVRSANDGAEAVEVAAGFRPDLILMDIGMPRLNGYAACRRIRDLPWGKSVVLVALTGWGQEDDKRRAEEAGFDHHFTKPVAPGTLERLLSMPGRAAADSRPT